MSYSSFIEQVWDIFHSTTQCKDMISTIEDSPWHREGNVLVHTNMVIEQFMNIRPINQWDKDDLKCYLACMFHDVGKPACEEIKHSEERGTYRSYGGHEQYSSCMFMDFALTYWDTFKLQLTYDDVFSICWLIQFHLPYKLGNDKLVGVARTLNMVLDDPKKFKNILIADQYGRISDTHEQNIVNMNEWFISDLDPIIDQYNQWVVDIDPNSPVCYVVTGPSGCGKSTYVQSLISQGQVSKDNVFSKDAIRYEMFADSAPRPEDALSVYHHIFQCSIADKDPKSLDRHFDDVVQQRFMDILKTNESFVIDNMNLTGKAYRRYTTTAKQKGYTIVHIIMPITLKEILSRHDARNDRGIPHIRLIAMYHGLVLPSINKYCDRILVLDLNK